MASEACPVCDLILRVETPAWTALVAKPARRLWPEKPVASMLVAPTLLDDERDGLPRQPLTGDVSMPVNRPEGRACFDPGDCKPALGRKDWTMASSTERDAHLTPRSFLVGLRAPLRGYEPQPGALDVIAIEGYDFRSPEPPGEAKEEKGAVAGVLHTLAHGVQDPEQVLAQQRLGFALGDPARTLDAPQRGSHDFGPAGVGQPPRLTGLRDRRDAANEGQRR
jgi:hypothetical protein